MTYRRSGDDNLLVEFGAMQLDLALRMRVHALMEAVSAAGLPGVTDLTPGIRSLQIQTDPDRLPQPELLDLVTARSRTALPPADRPRRARRRTVHLPLSWDDPATREAIARYMAGVRDDAPWCPWNIEFIRRINGLDSVDDVYRTVFDAEYLVLGLGDVYLGAPVATPLDPRHRLVTTKYNPARTWTAENSVGIGGAYLCIYGMEGPGGYQFVGRTTQVWSGLAAAGRVRAGLALAAALLRPDQVVPGGARTNCWTLRADITAGRFVPRIEEGTFSLAEYQALPRRRTPTRSRSSAPGRARPSPRSATPGRRRASSPARRRRRLRSRPPREVTVPPGARLSRPNSPPRSGSSNVAPGDTVDRGQPLLALEAMKMESRVTSPVNGVVLSLLAKPGDQVEAGTALAVVGPPAP